MQKPRLRHKKRTFPSQAGLARRAELLFRAHFPQFQTRLFEVDLNDYLIYTPEASKAKNFFENVFLKSWAPVSLLVRLSDEIPDEIVQEIELMELNKLHEGFEGLGLSIADIEDLLSIKVPGLPLPLRSRNENNPIPLIFSGNLTEDQDKKVREFFQAHLPEWPIEISSDSSEERDKSLPESHFGRPRMRDREALSLPFGANDESFWFDNIDAIFRGSQIDYLVPSLRDCGSSCYVDASSFDQVDLRQLILLYDTVFISPPLSDFGSFRSTFWDSQTISKGQFLELVKADRIRLVLTQAVSRLDKRLLEEIYEQNPVSIIGWRTISSLIASDIVRTAEEYTLLQPEFRSLVSPLVESISERTGLPFDLTNKGLLWPAFARASCFAPILSSGALGVTNFGIGSLFGDEIKAFTGRDLRIESVATNQGVHIAHVLNATFIPPINDLPGWNVVRNITADRLNFYRSFNNRISAAWIGNEERRGRKERIVPQLPFFKFRKHTNMSELLEISAVSSSNLKGRGLITRLSEISAEERLAEVERLSETVHRIQARRDRISLNIDTLDSISGIVDYINGFGLFPFKSSYNIAQLIIETGRKNRKFDRIIARIEEDMLPKKDHDISFLTKVHRIAELDLS